MSTDARFFTPTAAMSIVIANMIGTGVFTSLGFQLLDIQSPSLIIALWVVGGLIALCGALSYAELGAMLPRSGGEYHFLSEIYHPAIGFIAGLISATVGFAAPTALVAITFGSYLAAVFEGLSPTWAAAFLVASLTLVHAINRTSSASFQVVFTIAKVLLIIGFSAAVLWQTQTSFVSSWAFVSDDTEIVFSATFAVSLIYVNYAYTGWNAATYLSSELANPQRTLPWVLGAGTTVVVALYVLLNTVFLRGAEHSAMAGKVEIGHIVAVQAFGDVGGTIAATMLAILLISTASAMLLAGPRVLQMIGADYPKVAPLGRTNTSGIPTTAVMLQGAIALGFVLSASFEQILVFTGFTLGLTTAVTVAGLFVMRQRAPDLTRPYKVTGYPVTPLVFLTLTGWTLAFVCYERPLEAGVTLVLVALGWLLHRWVR